MVGKLSKDIVYLIEIMEFEHSEGKYSVCADIDHNGDDHALKIYQDHAQFRDQYNSAAWLLFFEDNEIDYLFGLVSKLLNQQGIQLPKFDVDGLSLSAISIYTTTDTTLLMKMVHAGGVNVNQIDPI